MIYLDNAATTMMKPAVVYERVTGWLGRCANPGRSGHRPSVEASRAVYAARETIAALFAIRDPLRVIFTCNGTDALNLAIHGALEPGDHVVTTSMEHNSVLRPLNTLTARQGISQTVVETGPSGVLDSEKIKAALTPRTKMLIVSHASNLTGIVTPLEGLGQMCRKAGILFLVDAAQSAGAVAIDVERMGIDLLAMAGHKGLYGLQGTGILYVGERACLREYRQGGTGSRSMEPFQPLILPDRYESGTLNLPGIVSLAAGAEYILENGLDTIGAHEGRLAVQMLEGLSVIPGVTVYGDLEPSRRLPVVSFNIGKMPPSQAAYLLDRDYGICSRPGFHCAPFAHRSMGTEEAGSVRLSAGFLNTCADVDAALRAVAEIAANVKNAV